MVVQHNLSAMNTNRQLNITTEAQKKSTEKLSSGYRINRAGDDAAGLAISEKMRAQIRGLDKASENAQNGISALQVAEGALNEIHTILQRMNELATQAANDTNTSAKTDGVMAKAKGNTEANSAMGSYDLSDRGQIQHEIDQLTSEINRIRCTTQFNSMNLIDGSFGAGGTYRKLQIGSLADQKISVSIRNMDAKSIGVSGLRMSTFAKAGSAMTRIQTAIALVSTQRAEIGALQNRLEHTIANLDASSENTSAAESRVRDTDMAKQMVDYSKNNILAQAGQSMLAQANQSTQGVLSLLG